VLRLLIDFNQAYESFSVEVSYNLIFEFGIPMNLVRLTIMCPNEIHRKVRVGKYLSDMFPARNGLKQGDTLSPFIFNFF
jgi:hypothetical protein